MKTIFNLKQYVALVVAIFAMTSCLKSEDEKFYVMGEGYVIQSVRELPGEEEGEVAITSSFTPVIYVGSNEAMAKCNVSAPGGESILMTQIDGSQGYLWISNESYMSAMSKLPSGTFSITGVNQEGEAAQSSVSINNSTEMKGKLKGEVKFADKQITATFNKVEGATNYMVMVKKTRSSTRYENTTIILGNYSASEIEKSQTVTLTEGTYSSRTTYLAAGSYYLTIAAVVANTSMIFLYQESDANATFVKE